MKIATVTVDVLRVPVARPYLAGGRTVVAHWHVMAQLRTSDGVEGAGYIVYPHGDLMSTIATAARELGTHLTGMSVLEPEAAWDRLARRADWVGPGGLLHMALAPLDIAIWDAAGKTLGQPLHRLLGGHRDRLPVYASDGLWYNLTPEDLAASARRHVEAGFGAVKLRLGKAPTAEAEARRVHAVREAVGPTCGSWWTRPRAGRSTARGARVACCRRRASRGWRIPSTTRMSRGSPSCGAGSRYRSRRASISITSTPSGGSSRPARWMC